MKRIVPTEFAAGETQPLPQHAALCWRHHGDGVEVLLVTSRDTGRWVLPKGWPIDGLTGPATAAQEAWEEAGVKGTVGDARLGVYGYRKVLGPHAEVPCQVSVFGLKVGGLAARFPERGQRQRKWFSAAKAARRVAEPELRALLTAVAHGEVALDPGPAPAAAGG